MKTRTKLNIAAYTGFPFVILILTSHLLGLTYPEQYVVLVLWWIPLGFVLFYGRRLRTEMAAERAGAPPDLGKAAADRMRIRKRLIVTWICVSIFVMTFPIWMPALSGINLRPGLNLIPPSITILTLSVIFGLRLRKYPKINSPADAGPDGEGCK